MKINMNKKNKLTIAVAAIAVVALVLVLVLVLCGGISEDPYEAKNTLIENGYKAELYAKGPDVTVWKTVYAVEAEGLEYVISAHPVLDANDAVVTDLYVAEDVLFVFYFADEDAADAAYDAIKAYMQNFAEQNSSAQEFEIDQSGNMIWFGTPNAIDAAY